VKGHNGLKDQKDVNTLPSTAGVKGVNGCQRVSRDQTD